jgi:hypothetical protein
MIDERTSRSKLDRAALGVIVDFSTSTCGSLVLAGVRSVLRRAVLARCAD